MPVTEIRPVFHQRLRSLARQLWLLHVLQGVALTVSAAVLLLSASAAVDYLFEVSYLARVAMFACGLAAVSLLGLRWIVRPARTWYGHRVVVILERLFPPLGQRMRTVLEYGAKPADQLARAGVEPTLVAALQEETTEKAKPLPLKAALPAFRMLLIAQAAVIFLALLGLSAGYFPEWQTALRRVTLSNIPYTTLAASPSAEVVDAGADVEIRSTMTGRARPVVSLHYRELGESDWREETMEAVDGVFTAPITQSR